MQRRLPLLVAATTAGYAAVVRTYNFTGPLPYTALDFFNLPFEIFDGDVEFEVAHRLTDPVSTTNILDWGVAYPASTESVPLVGWGGGNSENAVVGCASSSRSYMTQYGASLPLGNWSVVVGKPRIAVPPGHYSVNITVRDAATLPPQPERQPYKASAPLSSTAGWFAGDFHVHSRESGDAFDSASLDEIARFASATALLDFVHISDHNTVSAGDFMVDAQRRWPHLLLLPGVEYTTYGGHAGALFTTKFVDHRIGLPRVNITAASAAIRAQGGLLSINHMDNFERDLDGDLRSQCVGCAWDFGGSISYDAIDAIEVGIQAWDGTGFLYIPRVLEHWDKVHSLGFTHVTPIGGSDDHHGGLNETEIGPWREGSPIGSPTTMVFAANLSHAAIYEGVRLGRTMIKMNNASDPTVDFTAVVQGGAHGGALTRVGGTVPSGATAVSLVVELAAARSTQCEPLSQQQQASRALRGSLHDPMIAVPLCETSAIPAGAGTDYSLQLVRNNEVTFTAAVTQLPFSFNVTVPAPIAGTDRWRAELHFAAVGSMGQLVVLSNHIFLRSIDG